MNLIDAIKSQQWFGSTSLDMGDYPFCGQPDGRVAGPLGYVETWSMERLRLEDYQVQERRVTITASQFWDGVGEIFHLSRAKNSAFDVVEFRGKATDATRLWNDLHQLARRLGLEAK